MSTQAEKLQKGIDSLIYRIAALAERLPNESTSRGDNPRDTARQINEYGRTLAILRGLLDAQSTAAAPNTNALPAPVIKPTPSVFWNYRA